MDQAAHAAPGAVAGQRRAYQGAWWAVILLTTIYALNFLDRNIVNILLEPIKKEMALSDAMLGLISGLGFALFYALVSLPIARLADRSNRRDIVAAGLVLWSAMTALSGLAANVWQLLAARSGVGVGEAAGVPPSQSMIADMFEPAARPRAMGVFATGTYIGIFAGYFVGGWVSQYYGWRAAFLVAGLPGLLLALLLRWGIAEPVRGGADPGSDARDCSTGETLRFLLGSPTFLLVLGGFILTGVTNFATSAWIPSFLRRIHQLSQSEIGTYAGTVKGLCGMVATVGGGALVAWIGRTDARWRIGVPGICSLLGGPAMLWFLFAPTPTGSLFGLSVMTMLVGVHLGPVFAVFMSVVLPGMRAFTAALALAIGNLISLGLGPLMVGALSDRLAPGMGVESVRYALILPAVCSVAGGVLFLLAMLTYRRDIARTGG